LLLLPPRSVVLGCAYCLLNVVGQKRQQAAAFLFLVRDLLIEREFIEHFEAVAPIVILAWSVGEKEPFSVIGRPPRAATLVFSFSRNNGQTSGPSWLWRLRALFVRRHVQCAAKAVASDSPDNLPTWNAIAINADLNSHYVLASLLPNLSGNPRT
jgi:hypothetical protein